MGFLDNFPYYHEGEIEIVYEWGNMKFLISIMIPQLTVDNTTTNTYSDGSHATSAHVIYTDRINLIMDDIFCCEPFNILHIKTQLSIFRTAFAWTVTFD